MCCHPHPHAQYAVFGRVVSGHEALYRMEQVETRREGIFVMPKDRIEIFSSYVYDASGAAGDGEDSGESRGGAVARMKKLTTTLAECNARVEGLRQDLQAIRASKLP
jgi:hypothetical protein